MPITKIRTASLLSVLLVAAACGGSEDAAPLDDTSPLMSPASDAMNQTAPDVFRARFETSKGDFVIEVQREWAPQGADRFYSLVSNGFYEGVHFFRVIDGFMAQFGIHGNPAVAARWRQAPITDDPVTQSNSRGSVTFAMTGQPNSRTTQLFINFMDNTNLDGMGLAPFGRVVEGMDVVDQLYSGYGEGAPRGNGPDQNRIQTEGSQYLASDFPELDSVVRATIEDG